MNTLHCIKYIALASALLWVPVPARAALSLEKSDTPVVRVLVFSDRAQVTRAGAVACGPAADVEFASLPPSINPTSVRADAGAATVDAISLQQRQRTRAFSPQVEALEERQRAAELQLAEVSDARSRAQKRYRSAQLLTEVGNAQISREMPLARPEVKSWSAAYDQALASELQAIQDAERASAKKRVLQRTLADLQRQLQAFAEEGSRSETFATVRVSCPPGHSARVELTYVVGGASWTPAYEARAQEPGEGERAERSEPEEKAGEGSARPGSVALALYGTVVQRTGETWQHALLTLSTALPRSDATPPELAPLRVYADPREPPRKVLVRRDEEHEHAEAAGAAPASPEGAGGAEVALEKEGLSTQFAVSDPADVQGDGTPARLLLARAELPAKFAWRVFPSQLPYVFRAADLINTAPFALLPGPVDLFRKNGLSGRDHLQRCASGAPFHLSFGLEEKIKVKRIVVEELTRDTGLFSKGKRFRYRYAFELQSFLARAATVEVQDRVPVSELDDVSVELDDKTSPGYALQKDDGMVRWSATLVPRQAKRLELAFHVDVPSSYDLGGL